MFGIDNLALFMLSGFLLNITPGVDMLYIISRSSAQGFKVGAMAALGIGAGCLFHITFAALGLSVILATSAVAFTIIKIIGAGYLVYLGMTLLFEKNKKKDSLLQPLQQQTLTKVFWQGVLVNVLNPKVALFFLAFVPQFISVASTEKIAAFFVLGMIFNGVGTLWNIFVAWSATSISRKIKTDNRVVKWLKKTMGGLFVGFGVKLAFSDKT